MGLESFLRIHRGEDQGLLKRQTLNGYTALIILTLGLGSLTYGYTASIIGTTLGKYSSVMAPSNSDIARPTFLY